MTKPARNSELAAPPPRPGGIAARAHPKAGADYLAALNPEQCEAVEATEGPLLVLSAGSRTQWYPAAKFEG